MALGSFLLLLTAALVFLLSLLFVRSVVWSLELPLAWFSPLMGRGRPAQASPSQRFKTVFERLSRQPAWQIFVVAMVVCALMAAFAFMEVSFLNDLWTQPKKRIDAKHAAIGGALFGFVLTLAMVNRRAIWWLGGAATLAYFLVWIWLLFSPSLYANFLRTVGYGGGIPISIEFRDEAGHVPVRTMKCNLLLRTTEALLVSPVDELEVVEIPRDQIRTVTHLGGGLRRLPFRLPDTSGRQ